MTPCFSYPRSLIQKDGWRCGWFATYNLCTMKEFFSQCGNLKECNLRNRKDLIQFIQLVHQKDSHLHEKYRKKEWLNRSDIERMIMHRFQRSCFEGIKDINIVEESQFNMVLPKENYVIENINRFQSNPHQYPQFFIFFIQEVEHWFAGTLTDQCMFYVDSLIQESMKEQHPHDLLEQTYRLFHRIPPFPIITDIQMYRSLIRQILRKRKRIEYNKDKDNNGKEGDFIKIKKSLGHRIQDKTILKELLRPFVDHNNKDVQYISV